MRDAVESARHVPGTLVLKVNLHMSRAAGNQGAGNTCFLERDRSLA